MNLNSNFQLYGYVIIAIVALIYFLFKRLTNNRTGPVLMEATDTSIIITMYTSGVTLQKVSQGSFQNYNYSLLVTTAMPLPDPIGNPNDLVSSDLKLDFKQPVVTQELAAGAIRTPEGQIVMKIDLPVKSNVHILGFSSNDSTFKSLLGNTNLENSLTKVVLEGNFPDYFNLYCDKGSDVEIREVLDPTAMQFLLDFCTKMDWELFENTLYFVEARSSSGPGNNMTTVETSEDFVQKILPTLTNMSNTVINNTSQQTPQNTQTIK